MMAAVLYGKEHLQVEPVAVPRIERGDALVRVKVALTCGTDVKVFRRGYHARMIVPPAVFGHELAGDVVALGEGVTKFSVGQRVVAWPLIACGSCELCREGKENLCLNWKYFGLHRHGGYAEYACAPAASVLPMPEHLSFEEATALGVAGLTAYHAIVTAGQLQRGQTFMIWGGSGGVGTIAVQLANYLGATVITTVGKDEKKQALQSLGAHHIFNHYREDVAAEVRKLFPNGVDLLIDYVGPATFPKSFDLLKKGGQMLLCGILTGRETTLSIHQTYLRHLSVKGVYLGTREEMRQLMQLASSGHLRPVIGTILPLREAARAQEMMLRGDHFGKIVLTVD